ncbi:MAG: hypothetical protein AUK47_11955 [Deltaproteobacteria bacterium CG2_30_63_29]|nr:MAG: hypothetical protein AUK47_11955 [Deltaproteobacteria bacterium CG2_30_63_29]PJB33675.1 MAG: hypothetical protein CO108_30400 [Deltaproteobacteria bacterium CG_4_9_14_3_um_filter_63_12]
MQRHLLSLGIAMMALLTFVGEAAADEWITPTTKEVRSVTGTYTLTVTPPRPGSPAPSYPIAILKGPEGETTFELKTPWMAVDLFVFDDGRVLTLDQWHTLGLGDFVAVLYSVKGELLWKKTLEELLGEELAGQVPRSVSSRWWRGVPAETELVVAVEGKLTLRITLWNEDRLELRIDDGSTTLVPVADVGDDPERLMRRARALKDESKFGDAAVLLEKVVQIDPTQLDAYLEWADALERQGEVAAAVKVLEQALAQFGEQAPADKTYNYANLHVNLSKLYLATGDKKGARRALERGIAFERNYDYPVLAYAGFLLDEGEKAEADRVLEGFLAGADEPYKGMVTRSIGDFYRSHQNPSKAKEFYLLVYDPAKVTDQFLTLSLAEVYEELGERDKALAVWTQLVTYFEEMGPAFDFYLRQAREHVERLSAK